MGLAVKQSVHALVTGAAAGPGSIEPQERYQAGKGRMSKLTTHVLEDTDPESIRTRRRANYRAWYHVLAKRDDLEVVYPNLPSGICPQVFPVKASRPRRFLAELERCGVDGAHTWPRLSESVANDPAYETARRLAAEVVVLPVHQDVDTATIERTGKRLRGGRRVTTPAAHVD